jgi:ABC-2 type transport system permease protein
MAGLNDRRPVSAAAAGSVEAATAVVEPEREALEALAPAPDLATPAPGRQPGASLLQSRGTPYLLWRLGIVNVLAIARRELGSYFLSPAGWALATLIILPISGFGYLGSLVSGAGGLDAVFGVTSFLMILFIPALTMRLFAEERRQGTLELLLASPVRDWEAVAGKWLGGVGFFACSIAFTLVYVVLFVVYLPKVTIHPAGIPVPVGDLDWGLVITGYVGLLAAGAAFTAVGVLASSLTSNQIIALVGSWIALIMLWYLGGLVNLFIEPPYDQFFSYIAGQNRYDGFTHGLIELKDVVYFASIAFGCLFMATRVLESRRWRSP